jgi:ABC-type multidrug transport system ATPase subunit
LQEILRAEADRGRTILITTHLIAEWNGIADRCLLCREGRIERELDPDDLPHDFDAAKNLADTADDPHADRDIFTLQAV